METERYNRVDQMMFVDIFVLQVLAFLNAQVCHVFEQFHIHKQIIHFVCGKNYDRV